MSVLRKSFYTNWIDSGLFPQVLIEDNTTGTPVTVSTLNMSEHKPGCYLASFIPTNATSYISTARVYTDGTYSVVDTNYAASISDFLGIDTSGGSTTGMLRGDESIALAESSTDSVTIAISTDETLTLAQSFDEEVV